MGVMKNIWSLRDGAVGLVWRKGVLWGEGRLVKRMAIRYFLFFLDILLNRFLIKK
jgi:hypothetical protein